MFHNVKIQPGFGWETRNPNKVMIQKPEGNIPLVRYSVNERITTK
jgi:hypothetical protein